MKVSVTSKRWLRRLVFIPIVVACGLRLRGRLLPLATALVMASAHRPQSAPHSMTASTVQRIGGQDIVCLKRKSSGPTRPEFLSAVILPGRGMSLLQVTAFVPGKGVVSVLASPSIEEAAQLLNGGLDDVHGVKSFAFGSAFLVPYANRIRGTLSADRKTVTTSWNGKDLTLPAVWKGKTNPNAELHAIHGLILDRKTDKVKVENTTDGQKITGVLHAGDFGGYWPSKTDLTITIVLAEAKVRATVTAVNVGEEAEPLSIAWHPYFAIPSGDRRHAHLHIPASHMAEVNNYDDVFPTGRLRGVKGTKYDFNAPKGKQLGDVFMDDNFSSLIRIGGRVVAEVIDPASNYGLRVCGLSPEIKTLQVYAPPDKPFVVIEDQFNFADPFSKVWRGMDTGMVTLQPRQSVTWAVELELFVPGTAK